jgi:acetyl esterase/lipase
MKPSFVLVMCSLLVSAPALAAAPRILPLWPDKAPGEITPLSPEADTTKPSDNLIAGRPVIRLGNVSNPTITVYSPDPAKNTGAAVLVCPGGGYFILALDLEGTEVCEWLNSIGVTAVLLKYRVPARPGLPAYAPPLQDAQRALGLVRYQAKELGINPQRIGVLGFSAGGHLAAMLGNHDDARTYPIVDAADQASCRPNFVVLVYPGGLALEEKHFALNPELHVSAAATPPTFLAMAEDDPVHVEHAIAYYSALQQAKIPAEMHLYPTGGHGYGLRRTAATVTSWPDRVQDWMQAAGWLTP